MVGTASHFPSQQPRVRSSASSVSLDSDKSVTRHRPYAPPSAEPPSGTYHTGLAGKVSFMPYPAHSFHAPAPHTMDGDVVRLFFGQLPYFVTDMQLSWLCATFAGGRAVANPERIMKKRPDGTRQPTGCLHGYATAADADAMCAQMNKRLLIDETGVWFAKNTQEQDRLAEYLAALRKSRRKRLPNRPYDAVVVQLATSTYVPLEPMPLTEMPDEDSAPAPGQARRKAPAVPQFAKSAARPAKPKQVHHEVPLDDTRFAPSSLALYAPAAQPGGAPPPPSAFPPRGFAPVSSPPSYFAYSAPVPPPPYHHQPPPGCF